MKRKNNLLFASKEENTTTGKEGRKELDCLSKGKEEMPSSA